MLTNKEIGVLCYCRGCLNRKIGCGERKKGGRTVGTAIVMFASTHLLWLCYITFSQKLKYSLLYY